MHPPFLCMRTRSELGGTHVPYGITLKRFARDFSTRWKTGFLKGIHTVLAAPSLKPEKIATSGPLLKTRFALSAEMTLENTHVFIVTLVGRVERLENAKSLQYCLCKEVKTSLSLLPEFIQGYGVLRRKAEV